MIPSKPMHLEFTCTVRQPMYEYNKKWFLGLELAPTADNRIREIHTASSHLFAGKVIDPKEGNLLRVKVPYKYNRVTVPITGLKPLQEYSQGDVVRATIQYCGVWNVNGFSGPSWKLVTLGPHPSV